MTTDNRMKEMFMITRRCPECQQFAHSNIRDGVRIDYCPTHGQIGTENLRKKQVSEPLTTFHTLKKLVDVLSENPTVVNSPAYGEFDRLAKSVRDDLHWKEVDPQRLDEKIMSQLISCVEAMVAELHTQPALHRTIVGS